ncbi:DUF4870 domain-containing protein [Leucobacter sp. GX24907]
MSAQIPDPSGEGRGEDTTAQGRPMPPQPPMTTHNYEQAAADGAYQHGLGDTQQPAGSHTAPQGGEQAAPVDATPAGAPHDPPPAGGYAPPAGGYASPPGATAATGDHSSTVTLNYWLSVFFVWIPALIFYLMEKDKGDQLANAYHRDNLNFSLVRTGVYVLTWIVMPIDLIGFFLGSLLGLASLVLFIFHIIAAVKAMEGYRRGAQPEFIFNIPMVK